MKDTQHPREVATDDSQPAPHLTDDQFADLALAPTTPAVAAHLEACASCAQEARQFVSALTAFEQQSRLWAERHAAASPLPDYRRPAAGRLGFPSRSMGAAAAAALLIAAGIGIVSRIASGNASSKPVEVTSGPAKTASGTETAQPGQTIQTANGNSPTLAPATAGPAIGALPAAQVSPARLKADNELLSAIDGELRSDDAASVSMYGIADAPRVRPTRDRVTNE